MIALLVIFILIIVLSMTNIILQCINCCSKNEKVTVVKIPVDLLSELGFVKKGDEDES